MFDFLKNKIREYKCKNCSRKERNFYYGIKGNSDNFIWYDDTKYYLKQEKCIYCRELYWVIVRKEWKQNLWIKKPNI